MYVARQGSPESPPESRGLKRESTYRLAEAFKRAVSRNDMEAATRLWEAVGEGLGR